MHLNLEQQAAISETSKPVLVLAGPGTGKTAMMVQKYKHLVLDKGLEPDRILITTFTRKATEELEERIGAALREAGHLSKVEVHNFHGLCLKILEEFGEAGRYREPVILEGMALHRFLFEHRKALHWDTVPFVRFPDYPLDLLMRVMGRCISEGIPPAEAVRRAEALAVDADAKQQRRMDELLDYARNYGRVLELLEKQGILTYDLMLYHAVALLEKDASVRAQIQERFDYVLVDEVQDNNGLQARLVELIVGDRGCVTVVGDEDQGIYKFRGAKLGILKDFEKRFSPQIITLTQNYRSTPTIVEASKALIDHNDDRYEKPLVAAGKNKDLQDSVEVWSVTDEEQESIRIAQAIQQGIDDGIPAREIAVLYRSLNHKDRLLDELEARGIPYEVTNLGQLMAMREVRDLWAWLAVLNDPYGDNPALERVLSGVEIGIPLLDLGRVQRTFHARKRELAKQQGEDPNKARINIVEILRDQAGHEADDHIRHRLNWAMKALEVLSEKTRNMTALETAYEVLGWLRIQQRFHPDDAQGRQVLANLGDFLQVIKDYEETYPDARGLRGFLEYLDYVERRGANFQEREPDASEDSVKILTAHRAKGLQFTMVFVPALSKQRFPATFRSSLLDPLLHFEEDVDLRKLHVEEERRVMYVAMTRAKKRLVLTFPRSINASERARSEFLDEILDADQAKLEVIEEHEEPAVGESQEASERRHAELHGALVVSAEASAAELEDRLRRLSQVALEAWQEKVPREVLAEVAAAVPQLGLTVPSEEPEKSVLEGTLRLSASALNTYASCPRKFQFSHVLRIPSKMSASAVAGSNVHRALEEFHRRHKGDWRSRPFSDLVAVYDETRATKRFPSQEDADAWRDRELRILESYWQDEPTVAGEPAHFEAPFTYRDDAMDAVFHGYIDRIDEHPDGIEVIDYKTGTRDSPQKIVREDFQMPLYVVAMEDRGESVKGAAMYWMKEAGDGKGPVQRDRMHRVSEGKKADFTDEAMDAFRERLRDAVEGIRSGDFQEEPEDFKCRFCDYRVMCPGMEGS